MKRGPLGPPDATPRSTCSAPPSTAEAAKRTRLSCADSTGSSVIRRPTAAGKRRTGNRESGRPGWPCWPSSARDSRPGRRRTASRAAADPDPHRLIEARLSLIIRPSEERSLSWCVPRTRTDSSGPAVRRSPFGITPLPRRRFQRLMDRVDSGASRNLRSRRSRRWRVTMRRPVGRPWPFDPLRSAEFLFRGPCPRDLGLRRPRSPRLLRRSCGVHWTSSCGGTIKRFVAGRRRILLRFGRFSTIDRPGNRGQWIPTPGIGGRSPFLAGTGREGGTGKPGTSRYNRRCWGIRSPAQESIAARGHPPVAGGRSPRCFFL